MITFWIFSIAMVIVALFFLLRPFFIDVKKDEVERSALNVNITKERLAELETELEQDTISQSEYEQTREELEQALLYDVEQETTNIKKVNSESYNRFTRFVLIFSVPVFAIGLYAFLGQPDLIEGGKKQTATAPAGHGSSNGADKLATVEKMIDRLAAKLKENPNNAEGWFMLGRSYMSMKRYKEAVAALEKTNQLVPNNPTVMLQYADALTMSRGGQISGKPFELIKKAVEIKPDDPTGLWLLGMGYDEQGEYQKAISYWNLLLPLLKDDKSINEVKNLVRQAKRKSGIDVVDESKSDSIPANTAAEKKSITSLNVSVSIDKKLLKHVSANDTVFIFAKAVNGPPMPLAVVRKQVKDLPLEVVLDDTMAMVPSMKLSSFDQVQITARVSKTGKPLLQPGDFYSKEKSVKLPFADSIILQINLIAE